MSLQDTILSSIEAEIEVLKSATGSKPEPVVEATPTPVPVVVAKHSNPILQMAIDQANERLARETAK